MESLAKAEWPQGVLYLEHFWSWAQGAPLYPRITNRPHTDPFFFDGAHRGSTLEALIYA